IVGDDDALVRGPVGALVSVMIEDDLLDFRVAGDAFELTEPGRVNRLDHDQAPDRIELEPRGLDDEVELVGVQAVELANVPVERAGDADDSLRIKAPGSQHRRERVEIGVRVGCDDGLGPHPHIVAQSAAIASISTFAPDGNADTSTVERAGGESATWRAYTSFMAAKSSKSARKTVVFTSRSSPVPASARIAPRLAKTCSVCSSIEPVSSPCSGLRPICP